MIVLRAAAAIQNAKRLLRIIEQRKALEKEERELKAYFGPHFDGDSGMLKCGDVLVSKETKSRTGLDTEAVKAELGERYADFTKMTTFAVIDCKPC